MAILLTIVKHRTFLTVLFTLSFILTTTVYASDTKSSSSDNGKTIPFLLEKKAYTSGEMAMKADDTILNLPVEKLKDTISTLKKDLCPINNGGSFEAYIKVDVSTKLIGVGTAGEGGLKVIIDCSQGK